LKKRVLLHKAGVFYRRSGSRTRRWQHPGRAWHWRIFAGSQQIFGAFGGRFCKVLWAQRQQRHATAENSRRLDEDGPFHPHPAVGTNGKTMKILQLIVTALKTLKCYIVKCPAEQEKSQAEAFVRQVEQIKVAAAAMPRDITPAVAELAPPKPAAPDNLAPETFEPPPSPPERPV
jgi:hypothetical protein